MDRDLMKARGARAQALLNDELLTEAFKALEDSYIEAWRTSSSLDEKAREKLYLAVNIVGKVRAHLISVAANGKIAAQELDELARPEGRRFFRVP